MGAQQGNLGDLERKARRGVARYRVLLNRPFESGCGLLAGCWLVRAPTTQHHRYEQEDDWQTLTCSSVAVDCPLITFNGPNSRRKRARLPEGRKRDCACSRTSRKYPVPEPRGRTPRAEVLGLLGRAEGRCRGVGVGLPGTVLR